MCSLTLLGLLVAIFILTLTHGMENSGCPESKKLYPGDCRLFYKCVPLLDSAQAYVWVPSRCTAGLVFHPQIKRCVVPSKDWNCPHDDPTIYSLPYYDDFEEADQEDEEIQTTSENYEATTDFREILLKPAPSKVLNEIKQDEVPLSAVDNTSTDQIGNQMYRLTQLIDDLKASSKFEEKVTPVVYSALPQKQPYRENLSGNNVFPYKSDPNEYESKLIPTQLNKITAQLIMQTPTDELKYSKENLTPNPLSYANTDHLVSVLFQKYLANNSFMSKGEYVKRGPILIQTASSRKPELTSKHSDNSIIKVTNEYHLTTERNRISAFTNTNTLYGKSCLNGIRLPNPDDCTRYFLCNSSTAAMQSYTCPPNTAFNKLKRMCDVEEYQRCFQLLNEYNGKGIQREVPCDTQMCGGLLHTGDWNKIRFNCPGVLQFCEKRKACLPKKMCY